MKNTLKYSMILSIFVLFFYGCATPYQTRHDISSQKKLQSAHHWDVLATDVAEQFKNTLFSSHNDSIFVGGLDQTPFSKSFRELLVTRLVEKGLQVVTDNTYPEIMAVFSVNVLRHSAKRNEFSLTDKSVYSVLSNQILVQRGGEIGSVGETTYVLKNVFHGLPHTEVIITSSIIKDSMYLDRRTDIYYINDPDFWHYEQIPILTPNTEKIPRLKVTSSS